MADFKVGARVQVVGDATYNGYKGDVVKGYPAIGAVLVRLDGFPAHHTYEFDYEEVTKID